MKAHLLVALSPEPILAEILSETDLDMDPFLSWARGVGDADPETQRQYLETLPTDGVSH